MFNNGNLNSFLFVFMLVFASCENNESVQLPKEDSPRINQHLPDPGPRVGDKARLANLDKSPMDIIYFPVDYPVLKMSDKISGQPVARVIYSRPSMDGRVIFGNLVKYNAYWRLGANEATEIEFFRDVEIEGTKVKKGRYIMYCIPYKDKWSLRFNGDLYTWGLRVHSEGDIYSFELPVTRSNRAYEVFTMSFEGSGNEGKLLMAWENTKVYLPFRYD